MDTRRDIFGYLYFEADLDYWLNATDFDDPVDQINKAVEKYGICFVNMDPDSPDAKTITEYHFGDSPFEYVYSSRKEEPLTNEEPYYVVFRPENYGQAILTWYQTHYYRQVSKAFRWCKAKFAVYYASDPSFLEKQKETAIELSGRMYKALQPHALLWYVKRHFSIMSNGKGYCHDAIKEGAYRYYDWILLLPQDREKVLRFLPDREEVFAIKDLFYDEFLDFRQQIFNGITDMAHPEQKLLFWLIEGFNFKEQEYTGYTGYSDASFEKGDTDGLNAKLVEEDLTIRQAALLCTYLYEEDPYYDITDDAKGDVVIRRLSTNTSGAKLRDEFNKLQFRANRVGVDKTNLRAHNTRCRDFKRVVQILRQMGKEKAAVKAEEEYEVYELNYDKENSEYT